MMRTKGLQGSCSLILLHPTNMVLVCLQFIVLTVTVLFQVTKFPCSSLADDDYYEDDEEDDPDALKDPIYLIDLQVR